MIARPPLLIILTLALCGSALTVLDGQTVFELSTGEEAGERWSHKDHPLIVSHDGWCEQNGTSYSGYIEIAPSEHLFFYFFPARSIAPETLPTILWTDGGPGCSSSVGLFFSHGPCKLANDSASTGKTIHNPYSWTEKANLIFLDEPQGVGYSPQRRNISTSEAAAEDVVKFLVKFFKEFPEYSKTELHLGGASYSGKYLPAFASAIIAHNKASPSKSHSKIDLKSIINGNAVGDIEFRLRSPYSMYCERQPGLGDPPLQGKDCELVQQEVESCFNGYKEACATHGSNSSECFHGWECESVTAHAAGRCGYDLRQNEPSNETESTYCNDFFAKFTRYLSDPSIQRLLGVDKLPLSADYSLCSGDVGSRFSASHDIIQSSRPHIEDLLRNGVKALYYAGTTDAACDHVQILETLEKLSWSGSGDFLNSAWTRWIPSGDTVAGEYKSAGPLTFLKVFGAGHMVPYNKPAEALAMLSAWLDNNQTGL